MRLISYQSDTKIYMAYITEYTSPTQTTTRPHPEHCPDTPRNTQGGILWWVQDEAPSGPGESAILAPSKFDDGPDRHACHSLPRVCPCMCSVSSSLSPNGSAHAKRIPTVQSVSLRTCLTRLTFYSFYSACTVARTAGDQL